MSSINSVAMVSAIPFAAAAWRIKRERSPKAPRSLQLHRGDQLVPNPAALRASMQEDIIHNVALSNYACGQIG
jgi:hypothetical protein